MTAHLEPALPTIICVATCGKWSYHEPGPERIRERWGPQMVRPGNSKSPYRREAYFWGVIYTSLIITMISPISQIRKLWNEEVIQNTNCCCWCSVSKACLSDPMDCSTPDLPNPHYLPEFAQVHVHWVGDAIQQSDPLPLSSPFSPYKWQSPNLNPGTSVTAGVYLTFTLSFSHLDKVYFQLN